MEIASYSVAGIPLLSLEGDFDRAAVSLFAERADAALRGQGKRLLLQLTDCPYMDSGGVSALLSCLHRVRGSGWLGVIGPDPNVLRLLETVGLSIDPSFRVFTGLEEVLAEFESPTEN